MKSLGNTDGYTLGKRLGCVFVELDAQTFIEVFGTDGATGTGTHVNEKLIICNDAVKYLMTQIEALLVLTRAARMQTRGQRPRGRRSRRTNR